MLHEILNSRFRFTHFRPKQEAICRAVAEGSDTLVVMPTGAGKSLCYQVPGLARKGATLVISPLLALIEDQVQALQKNQIRADRIHSGRTREESRETFRAYLEGKLEFLFIAPERLAVPGFVEMLIKFPPSLIAIDEAHCISQWGHDFRPDYRLVGERLLLLSQTPRVALTATATPQVQDDICTQLKLKNPKRFIHGFRRENLAIRSIEALPSERLTHVLNLLKESSKRPAIVYAPTRKKAEEIANELKKHFKTAAYHAGMDSERREKAQLDFLENKNEVIVATVAFGMGIDKPNVRTVIHAAMPGSLEGYYQEIGRAGRDGLPSQAVLLYSISDRKTHEFFLDQDHPDPASELRKQRLLQIDQMQAFTSSSQCRMVHLIEHFGDVSDAFNKCGACDRCVPMAEQVRTFDAQERAIAVQILAELEVQDGQAVGKLFKESSPYHKKAGRLGFERILAALSRARMIRMYDCEFEKNGKVINYRKVNILAAGRLAQASDLEKVIVDGIAPSEIVKGKRTKGRRKNTTRSKRSFRKKRRSYFDSNVKTSS